MPLQLPPAGEAAYLVGHLFEAGPLGWAGMGEVPLAWSDLQAWQAGTGIELEAWEARALRRMSGAYVTQLQAAREPGCLPPWAPEAPASEARESISNRLRASLRAMAHHPNSKRART